jgi:hypothetical protein
MAAEEKEKKTEEAKTVEPQAQPAAKTDDEPQSIVSFRI